MSNGVKYTLIIICTFAILIGGSLFVLKNNRKVSENPAGTIGNTAGNLQNGGLFCESEGVVFFSNPYDHNFLYSMNADETDCKRVNTSMIRCINAGKEDLYYYQYDSDASEEYGFISNLGGLFRSSKKGGRTTCIKKNTIGNLLLVDNIIYYLNYEKGGTYNLNSITTAKKEDQRLLDGIVDPSCYGNGNFYYVVQDSESNHYLNSYNLNTKMEDIIYAKDVWFPQIYGEYIYFLDIHNDYRLCRYSLISGNFDQLTAERIDCYNLTGEYIYYQVSSSSDPFLGMMRNDGTMQTRILSGVFTKINATSKYVYFSAYGVDSPIYHVPIGGTNAEIFTSGMEAMKKYY